MNLNIQRRPGVMNSFLQGYLGGQQVISEQMKNALIQQKLDAEARKENALLEYGQTQDMNKLMQAAPEVALDYAKLAQTQQKTQLDVMKFKAEQMKQAVGLFDKYKTFLYAGLNAPDGGQAIWEEFLNQTSAMGLPLTGLPREMSKEMLDAMSRGALNFKDQMALDTPKYSTFSSGREDITIAQKPGQKPEIISRGQKDSPWAHGEYLENKETGVGRYFTVDELRGGVSQDWGKPAANKGLTGRTKEIHDALRLIGGDPKDKKQFEDMSNALRGRTGNQISSAIKLLEKDIEFGDLPYGQKMNKLAETVTELTKISKNPDAYSPKEKEEEEEYKVYNNRTKQYEKVSKETYEKIRAREQNQ